MSSQDNTDMTTGTAPFCLSPPTIHLIAGEIR